MANTLLSSSPDRLPRQYNVFHVDAPQVVLSSSPQKGGEFAQTDVPKQDGELSPTFDASFASSMSFNSAGSDPPNAMDISPAIGVGNKLLARPLLTRNLKSLPAQDNKAFFSRLSANKPKRAGSSVSTTNLNLPIRNSDEIQPRIFGNDINININNARPKQNHERSKSEAVLFDRGPLGRRSNAIRPGITDAATLSSASININDAVPRKSSSSFARRPSMPDAWRAPPMPARANTEPSVEPSRTSQWPSIPALIEERRLSAPITTLQTHPEEISSPPVDPMDIDIISPQPAAQGKATHNLGPIHDDGSFSELFDASPQPQLPLPTRVFPDGVPSNPKKRSFEADEIEELSEDISSEGATPSSPLGKALAARPPLQKANTTAATGSFLSHSQRRRLSERSSLSRSSVMLTFAGNTRQAVPLPPPIPAEPAQLAKKVKAEHPQRPSLLQSRRTQSVCEPKLLQVNTASTIGIGRPPSQSQAKDYFAFKPSHNPSASESLRPRPASDTLASHNIDAISRQSNLQASKGSGPNLWGAESDGKALPCYSVKSDGLMRITPKVVADLVVGKYNALIDRFVIIDCRFPWEFEGGHIRGAINLHTTAQLDHFFFTPNGGLWQDRGALPVPSHSSEETAAGKTIIIFHCEFSCMRAPQHAGHIRSQDRSRCKDFYPRHLYPETYIIAGGFAAFYETFGNLCDPQGYVQMKESADCPKAVDEFRRRSALGRAKSFTFGDDPSDMFATRAAAPPPPVVEPAIKEESSVDTSNTSNESIGDSPCPPNLKGRLLKGHSLPARNLQRAVTESSSSFGSRVVTR